MIEVTAPIKKQQNETSDSLGQRSKRLQMRRLRPKSSISD